MKFRYDKEKNKLIISDAERIEYNQVQLWLKTHAKGYRFNRKFKMGIWDGTIDHFHQGSINIGLWKECLKACNEIGTKFEIENKQEFPLNREVEKEHLEEFCKEFFKGHKVKDKDTGELIPFFPYDYQIETAFKILKNRYCIGEVATSGGKSLILSIVFFYIWKYTDKDAKQLLIVPSITLVTQFYDDIVDYNNGMLGVNENKLDIRIQEIMSDKPRKHSGQEDPNLFISTYQSLAKTSNWGNAFYEQFYTVAVDECHQAKIISLVKILQKTFKSAEYRFGVSGTFPEDDTAEILTIQSVCGPKVTSIKAKMLQDQGKIANLKIKCIYLNHNDHEFDNQLKDIRKNVNLANKAYQLEKKYIHDSIPRMMFIKKLIGKFKSNGLVLFNIIEHGKRILETLEEAYPEIVFLYIDGSVKKKDREEYKKLMELDDGQIRILVATFGTLSTGVSINNIHNIVFCDSFKSETRIIQSIGRGLRLHEEKDKAIIFDLIDVFKESGYNNSFYRHSIERQSLYRKHQYEYDKLKFIL